VCEHASLSSFLRETFTFVFLFASWTRIYQPFLGVLSYHSSEGLAGFQFPRSVSRSGWVRMHMATYALQASGSVPTVVIDAMVRTRSAGRRCHPGKAELGKRSMSRISRTSSHTEYLDRPLTFTIVGYQPRIPLWIYRGSE
jgi:hypothetical protein